MWEDGSDLSEVSCLLQTVLSYSKETLSTRCQFSSIGGLTVEAFGGGGGFVGGRKCKPVAQHIERDTKREIQVLSAYLLQCHHFQHRLNELHPIAINI